MTIGGVMFKFWHRRKVEKPDDIAKGDIVTVYSGEDIYKGTVVNTFPLLIQLSANRTVLSVPRGAVQKDALATKHQAVIERLRQVA